MLARIPLILVFLLSLLAIPANASDFEQGVAAARAKHWKDAETAFRASVNSAPENAYAYYNLGTSLAAQDKQSEAIWALEKSLKLNPMLKAAQTNLQYCYTKLGIPESWEPALPYFQHKAYQFGIDSWTYISIALAIVSAVLLFVFIVSGKPAPRKISLIFAVFMVIALIFSLRNALNSYHFRYSDTHAVLIRDESSVFHDTQGNRRFDLNLKGGTRYEIGETANGRIGLMMPNQLVVWVDEKAVRVI